jgi:hypothetical protein
MKNVSLGLALMIKSEVSLALVVKIFESHAPSSAIEGIA